MVFFPEPKYSNTFDRNTGKRTRRINPGYEANAIQDPVKGLTGTTYPVGDNAPAESEPTGGLISGSLGNISNIASGGYTPGPEELVEGRLQGLLERGSPLMDLERRRAINFADERGLQNTLLAGTAGEVAAIEKGLEIAEPDARFLQERNLVGTRGLVDTELSAQGAAEAQDLTRLQGDISGQLQTQTDTAALARQRELTTSNEKVAEANRLSNEGISNREIASRLSLTNLEIASLESRQAADIESRESISDAGIKAQIEDTTARLAGDALNNFNSSLSNLYNEYVAQNSALARDQNLTPEAREQAQADLQALYETGAASLASIWSDEDVVWSPVVPEEGPPPEPGETEPAEAPAFDQEEYSGWFQANKNADWFKDLQAQGALLPVGFYNWSQENVGEDWFEGMSNKERVDFFDTNIRPNLPSLGLGA